jgi:hypothetical protein
VYKDRAFIATVTNPQKRRNTELLYGNSPRKLQHYQDSDLSAGNSKRVWCAILFRAGGWLKVNATHEYPGSHKKL